ncbi:MAG: DUF4914 family protein [bacterium]
MVLQRNALDEHFDLDPEIKQVLKGASSVTVAQNSNDLYELALPGEKDVYNVDYEVDGKMVSEAEVCRVKNGLSVNYPEPYMRRRDPNCMLIGDDLPSDKRRFEDEMGNEFDPLRKETFEWLADRDLAVFPFMAGQANCGIPAFAVVPANAGFFAFGLGLLQGVVDIEKYEGNFEPKLYMYVAPPFRHTHFDGRQIVVHNRSTTRHEVFSYNLYPGPSAKKGVYSALLHFGEMEDWVTAHASVVRIRTPYNNTFTIMHEGASGGGKSEMNEHLHRAIDGTLLLGTNPRAGEDEKLILPRCCELEPVADDMVLCHKDLQQDDGKLTVADAEDGWFIRVDHIENYGTDPDIEARSLRPQVPLLFLNIDAQPGSTALLWEHIEDEPGVPCPNPRFVLPRKIVPDIVNKPLNVDIRSFGVRTPPCTKEEPNYGILGIFHILPPALAWLWRLVSPRGFDNPSIVDTGELSSEGVGSYWPFATGSKVAQANLLLKQFMGNPEILNVLCPIKHIGAWETGFMPEWIMREYLPRRGGRFQRNELSESRCNLLGYCLNKLVVEGQPIRSDLLKVERQPEVGKEAYDEGAKILVDFFKKELQQYLTGELHPLGRKTIECFLNDGAVRDYESLIETNRIFTEN